MKKKARHKNNCERPGFDCRRCLALFYGAKPRKSDRLIIVSQNKTETFLYMTEYCQRDTESIIALYKRLKE